MSKRTCIVLPARRGVAIYIAFTIICQVVANPKLKSIQPLRAAIAPVPNHSSGHSLGLFEIHSPPIVRSKVCDRKLGAVTDSVVCK